MAEFHAKHDVEVEWLAYELRPEPLPLPDVTGPGGDRFRQGWERGVAPLARRLGVEMRYPAVKPRSRKAHEAAEHARANGQFDAMRTAIFRAYFVDGRDIGQVETLVDIGRAVGLDPDDLRAALDTGRWTERVVAQEEESRELGIGAVPSTVVGRYLVEGAQPYDILRQALEAAQRAEP